MMRCLLLAALPALLLGQANGVVEGTVIDGATRTPVASANVNVMQALSRNGQSYEATTDARGFFHIEGIREEGAPRRERRKRGIHAGVATLSVEGGGRAGAAAVGTASDAQVERPGVGWRRSSGSGRDGATGSCGRRWAVPARYHSDKDGRFNFPAETMPNASALLRAIPPPKLCPPKSPEDEPEKWAPTYYPNVTEQFRAQPVTMPRRGSTGVRHQTAGRASVPREWKRGG